MKAAPSHSELVRAACVWMKTMLRCDPVFPEFHTLSTKGEKPDVIGFRMTMRDSLSILVECKAYRGDFLHDLKKPFRVEQHLGMGQLRWYFAPPGLIRAEELPHRWGLAEYESPKRIRRVVQATEQDEWALHHERSLLIQEIRRSTEGNRMAKWGSKRFRGDAPSPPKVIPCRGAPFCPGCDFCRGPGYSATDGKDDAVLDSFNNAGVDDGVPDEA